MLQMTLFAAAPKFGKRPPAIFAQLSLATTLV
jgi:hypothetical protein